MQCNRDDRRICLRVGEGVVVNYNNLLTFLSKKEK